MEIFLRKDSLVEVLDILRILLECLHGHLAVTLRIVRDPRGIVHGVPKISAVVLREVRPAIAERLDHHVSQFGFLHPFGVLPAEELGRLDQFEEPARVLRVLSDDEDERLDRLAGSGCTLFIRSDGEETEETYLKDSIKRRKLLKKGAPAPLDNSGIAITWCGTAESRGSVPGRGKRRAARSSASADFTKQLWSTLFTSPELIVFEPLCLARDSQGPRLYYGEEA